MTGSRPGLMASSILCVVKRTQLPAIIQALILAQKWHPDPCAQWTLSHHCAFFFSTFHPFSLSLLSHSFFPLFIKSICLSLTISEP